jgi:hypothetical protein
VVAWAVVWFIADYALYAAVYGALGSLVGRQQEVGQVTGLPAALLLVGYLGATFVPGDPESGMVVLGSILPPFAPMMMPMRVAAGGVPAGQLARPRPDRRLGGRGGVVRRPRLPGRHRADGRAHQGTRRAPLGHGAGLTTVPATRT